MKKILLSIAEKTIGVTRVTWIYNFKSLIVNFIADFNAYYQYSNVFKVDNLSKIESKIILDYHSVEKGLLFKNFRAGFAKNRIVRLIRHLSNKQVVSNYDSSQILVAYKIMCQYYEIHEKVSYDISSFYSEAYYKLFKDILDKKYCENFKGAIDCYKEAFYSDRSKPFDLFSESRKSIRDFTGESIAAATIHKAVNLALNAPSVCNRQASKVYYIDNRKLIEDTLKIQGGFTGYTANVKQLLIVTCDRNYFYTIGERNQFYIDGGIFVMNLLYALHFYEIANCPANWGKTIDDEKRLAAIIQIPVSEKIICMIPIGIAKEEFRVTLSKRRDLKEVFHILN